MDRRGVVRRHRQWLLLLSLALAFHTGAIACALCFSAFKIQPSAQQLIYPQRVVLATPTGDGHWRVAATIKGDSIAGSVLEGSVTGAEKIAALPSDQRVKPALLMREDAGVSWVYLGSISIEHAPWLKDLAGRKRSYAMTPDERQRHASSLLPMLESREPLVADIAYTEVSATPYGTLRSLKPQLDAESLRRWVADPRLIDRRPLYVLLLAIAGDPEDAQRVRAEIEIAWRARDASQLAPLLAADMELRGNAGVETIEKLYLLDRSRSPAEIQAALLALSEQGKESGAVARDRVVVAYQRLIRTGNPLCGLVAQDLGDWNDWSAVPDYVRLLRSGSTLHPASRFAIIDYLKRSGSPAAKTALSTLASAPR